MYVLALNTISEGFHQKDGAMYDRASSRSATVCGSFPDTCKYIKYRFEAAAIIPEAEKTKTQVKESRVRLKDSLQ